MQTDHEAVSSRESSLPNYKLYPVNAVTWATVFGSPLAGGVILAVNFGRLNQAANKKRTLVLSFLGTVALFTLFFLIPEDIPIPNVVYLVPQFVAMHFLARSLQGKMIDSHVSRGGSLVSVWNAVGIGLVCLLGILMVFVVGVFVVAPFEFDPVVEINTNDHVFFSDGATREDAVLVGRVLTETGYLGGPSGASVAVSVSGGEYSVSFVLADDAWEDPEVVEWVRAAAEELSKGGLGRPLQVHLCDDLLRSHKVVWVE